MSWGPAAAKVTILDFSDFGCSHCADFALNQGQQLRAEYEKTGQVRFEYKPFVLDWNRTADPANAAACAADQGKFWDYHDALFARQGSSAQAFSTAALKGYAAELGLDATTFNRCVDKKERYDLLDKVGAEGRARGVNATPTFFINGQKIRGGGGVRGVQGTDRRPAERRAVGGQARRLEDRLAVIKCFRVVIKFKQFLHLIFQTAEGLCENGGQENDSKWAAER